MKKMWVQKFTDIKICVIIVAKVSEVVYHNPAVSLSIKFKGDSLKKICLKIAPTAAVFYADCYGSCIIPFGGNLINLVVSLFIRVPRHP